MIQRIQSLYLLITAVITALVVFLPLARYLSGGEEFLLTASGLQSTDAEVGMIARLPYLAILGWAATLLPFVTIFLYRNRLTQIRMCIVELVLLFGTVILTVYYLYYGTATFGSAADYAATYSVVNILPVVGLILTWLALRAITKDEALVRSVDRIR